MTPRLAPFIAAALFLCCGGRALEVSPIKLGQGTDRGGNVTRHDLTYSFTNFSRRGKTRDLFNHIYFQGDGIFFSFRVNRQIALENITVTYTDETGKAFLHAERIEAVNHNSILFGRGMIVHGFSLVGSVLETFYRRDLDRDIPPDHFCGRKIPFVLSVEVNHEGKTVTQKNRGAFTLRYR